MSEYQKAIQPIDDKLAKLGAQWVEYANGAAAIPKRGATRERMAHAFAAGAYVAGFINDGAMFLVSVRGSSALEAWAKGKGV